MSGESLTLLTRVKRFLLGKPLTSHMALHSCIPKWKALPILSSDALSSVAYATEEVLLPLAALSALAVSWSVPIALAIGLLLFIITASYLQTIDAYPGGGGAYTVAKENLGTKAGLVAGASLLLDYILTVAVSVAAGVENLSSAFPFLLGHKELIGAIIILFLMLSHLRGVKESAGLFCLSYLLFYWVSVLPFNFWIRATHHGGRNPNFPRGEPVIPRRSIVLNSKIVCVGLFSTYRN